MELYSVQVTLLEVQVDADVIVVERRDVASLLWLTPLCLELLLLSCIIYHFICPGFILLDETITVDLSHRFRLVL